MKYHTLNRHIGREVYIAGLDGDLDTGELGCFDSLSELNDHLSSLNPVSDDNIIVVHGVLTQAEYIPPNIGRSAFIVIADPKDSAGGAIINIEDCNMGNLVSNIENLFGDSDTPFEGLEIDNVFILYGYELNLGFCVREDQVDERIFDECEEVAMVAEEMRKRGEAS
jgi:hypothetical protein